MTTPDEIAGVPLPHIEHVPFGELVRIVRAGDAGQQPEASSKVYMLTVSAIEDAAVKRLKLLPMEADDVLLLRLDQRARAAA